MRLKTIRLSMALLLTVYGCVLFAQNGEPPPAKPAPPPRPQYFHGRITEVAAQRIKVSRSLVGHRPESRTFLITAQTKINRNLRPRAIVTVRFQHLPEGDVALEIHVRQVSHPARP